MLKLRFDWYINYMTQPLVMNKLNRQNIYAERTTHLRTCNTIISLCFRLSLAYPTYVAWFVLLTPRQSEKAGFYSV